MFEEESLWIKNVLLNEIDLSKVSIILDVGSGSLFSRTKIQPYIEKNIFKPLKELGKKCIHLDIKKDEGVDYVCDINELDKILDKINAQFDVIICANVLEHVIDPKKSLPKFRKTGKKKGLFDSDSSFQVFLPSRSH